MRSVSSIILGSAVEISDDYEEHLLGSQRDAKLPVIMSPKAALARQSVKTRYPVHAQVVGKVVITCPNCGNVITSRLNWNTWRVKCKWGKCQTTVLIGLHALIPRSNTFKRKYVRPIDTTFPRYAVLPWSSGEPANRLLSTR